MKKILQILFIFVIIFGLIPNNFILGQNIDTNFVKTQYPDTTFLPSRGNHVFTSISSVDDPFVSTKFTLGFGIAEMIETQIPINIGEFNRTIEFEPDIFYSTGGAEFQYAIRNWAAVNIKAYGLARLGNNFLSLASEGVSAASSFNIGWLFRIAENENLMFSASISLNTTDLTFIDILGKADTVYTQIDTIINKQIVTDYQSLTTQTDLRFAVRFSDVFGLVTKLSGGFGEFYAGESGNKFQYQFGLALSVDLRNWLHIPFGVGLGGTLISSDWRFNDAKPPVYSGNINIAFYNRNDFTLGLENFIQFIEPQKYEQTFKFIYSKIYMSYYF